VGRLFWLVGLALAGALTGYLFTRFEGKPPQLEVLPGSPHVGSEEMLEVRALDEGTGVEAIRVWIDRAGQTIPLAEEHYPGSLFRGADLDVERRIEIMLRPEELGLTDGAVVVRAEASDYAWRGNRSSAEATVWIDTVPPRVVVATGLTYVRRGGAEIAVYALGERTRDHGVQIGDRFFPGYPHPTDPDRFIALYAVEPDARPDPQAEVVAVDRAGNRTAVPLSISIIEQGFPRAKVRLTDAFMEAKLSELLPEYDGDVLEGYLQINRELRQRNAEQIANVCARSSSERLWSEPFLQLPNSQVNARFAERRTYLYSGKTVDEQTHLGFDLASTARAEVPSPNDGVVQFAEDLGIYGKTVIVDHGLGLFTLHGHLSEIAVERGQAVVRGEPLGRTGATGLAGGDHLHFAVLVSGVFVDPLEWFDPRWIREHVEAKLGAAEPGPT
jgi:murein DD-endopeptidase MepM/ murein hydrolase activator NlpD